MNLLQLQNMKRKPTEVSSVIQFKPKTKKNQSKYSDEERLAFITEVKRIGLKNASKKVGIAESTYYSFARKLNISIDKKSYKKAY